jgi:hypothetical protein
VASRPTALAAPVANATASALPRTTVVTVLQAFDLQGCEKTPGPNA